VLAKARQFLAKEVRHGTADKINNAIDEVAGKAKRPSASSPVTRRGARGSRDQARRRVKKAGENLKDAAKNATAMRRRSRARFRALAPTD